MVASIVVRRHNSSRHRPTKGERDAIAQIIMDELVYGIFKPDSVAVFQRVIDRMKAAGCDAVVLGCTEIPLIISDANASLPTLDSTRLLARAALKRAVDSGLPRSVPSRSELKSRTGGRGSVLLMGGF